MPFDDMPPAWDIPPEVYEEDTRNGSRLSSLARHSAAPIHNGHDAETKPRVVLRLAHEIVAEKRETTWLLHKVIEARVLAVLAGPRGTFKSFIALDWLMRIAVQGHTVVILSGEGAGLDRRIDAWMRTHGADVDLESLSILVLERPLNLSLLEDMSALREALAGLAPKPAAVAVDTFSKFSAGIDENDNSEVAAYLSLLSVNIREAFDATVLLVAHSGHSDAKRPRGASALMANPDAEYIVDRPNPTAMTVTVSRERFKDGSALPPLAYEARVVDLGRADQYGDRVTSLALVTADVPVVVTTKLRGKYQERLDTALKEFKRTHPAVTHISSIDMTALCKTHDIPPKRRREVFDSFVNARILSPAIGGYTFHGENL